MNRAVDLAVVVPVRAFDMGKSRLAESLTAAQRERLARAMAEIVVDPRRDSRRGARWFVVCDDDSIDEWARSRGASPVRVTSSGLNPSLTEAASTIATVEASHVVLSHADLPLAADLVTIVTEAIDGAPDSILVAPDRHRDGSNVIVIPRHLFPRWEFRYGRGSFPAHCELARELGAPLVVIDDERLSTDIDTVDDLDLVRDFVKTTLPDWTLT
ncbi:MAG: 2-phospho-L-lactate guanylyltransferase [Actinomycetota bacterium]